MRTPSDKPISERPTSSFINEMLLAAHWDISCRTLQRWRRVRKGPEYCIIGGSVRYRIQDILDYESRHRSGAGAVK